MKRWFWRNGRLPWPLVFIVVYLSLSVLAVDYAWRVVKMPIETFMSYAIIVGTCLAGLAIALYFLLRRQSGRTSR